MLCLAMGRQKRASVTRVRIERRGRPDLVFTGKLIARVSSDSPERWTEIIVYEIEGTPRRWVAHVVGRSTVAGEVDYHDAHVCHSHEDLVRVLKHGHLAKRIYRKLGIDDVEVL